MPSYIDVFISPIRDNPIAQMLLFGLLIAILLDIVSGFAGAVMRHEVESSKMRHGIMHKIAELMIVIVADIVDGLLVGGFQLGIAPVLIGTLSFLLLMELMSICENCVKMNQDFAKVPLIGQIAKYVKEFEERGIDGLQPADEQHGSDEQSW